MHFVEISAVPANATKFKKNSEFPLDAGFENDFPVFMHVSSKFGCLLAVTKFGFLYCYEITTASLIYKTRIVTSPIFIGAKNS
jgi:hypothetical protein